MHRIKLHSYSITSSARVSSVGGIMMPSAFAVFKLITSSYLVGCSTGRSAGFAPLKILSMKTAAPHIQRLKIRAVTQKQSCLCEFFQTSGGGEPIFEGHHA